MVTASSASSASSAYDVAAAVVDPELPVLTIADLGVLRDVRTVAGGAVEVDITPTYIGCPALETIRSDVENALHDAGFESVAVRTVLAPAWSTDWISEAGLRKLRDYGIAPPSRGTGVTIQLSVKCPNCDSLRTKEITRFGSTACKALWVCDDCGEPFDRFKEH
jgi:ring-1,2-phenylacetyl-CoA epoxidase subunit PaaD